MKLIDSLIQALEKKNQFKIDKIIKDTFKEDATVSTTSAADIASVDTRIPMRKKKKKKKIEETASAGSTNAADFSNDFGTDTPRLPTIFGSLDGNKSMGMYGGVTKITFNMFNAFVAVRKKRRIIGDGEPAHYALNKDYEKEAGKLGTGDSTTKEPVKRSPYDSFVPAQDFVFKKERIDKIARRAGVEREVRRRKSAINLTKALKQAFLDSIDKIKGNDFRTKSRVDKHLKDFSDTDKTKGKDEK